jgi:hypothetical protein
MDNSTIRNAITFAKTLPTDSERKTFLNQLVINWIDKHHGSPGTSVALHDATNIEVICV